MSTKQTLRREELKKLREFAKKEGLTLAYEVVDDFLQNRYRYNHKKPISPLKGGFAQVANRNSKSGIPGLQVLFLGRGRDPILNFTATWTERDSASGNTPKSKTFSARKYGLKKALRMALEMRAEKTGHPMMTMKSALKILESKSFLLKGTEEMLPFPKG